MTTAKTDSSRRKLALVIGNKNYKRQENRLKHATNNARKLSDLLTTLHFEVTIHCNIEKNMMKIISDFADTINDDDMVLFYYSGNCRQTGGENYLIPTDDEKIERNLDIEDIGASVQNAMKRLTDKNKSCATIFILDCCKQYLLKKESVSNPQDKGLKAMSPPDETFIQFACAASETSSQNLFTKHLLRNIRQENVPITEIFQQIVHDVSRKSHGMQNPLTMNGLRQHHQLYLNEMSDKALINDCNKRIDELKLELQHLTLEVPHNGDCYDRAFTRRMEKIEALIHKLKLKRNEVIVKRYSAHPIE
ncbi:hypothetical protein I4U23_015722 [Adineta vaga]|nr:hypothetical protein I4U23_015722 [Adineta vaga]